MVRQVKDVRTPGWKALLAVGVAAGGLLWHVLACTESPMAFSPGGKDLAFVTMDPYKLDDIEIEGTHVYRLMVVSGRKTVRVVEETTKYMLTAPTYSPDGKCLTYLRIPLLTKEQQDKLRKQAEERSKLLDSEPGSTVATQPSSRPARGEAGGTEDISLPPIDGVVDLYKAALLSPPAPVQLVVRDALATDMVIATVTMDLPVHRVGSGDAHDAMLFTYLLARPQYTPDGKWVHFCVGQVAAAIDPKTGSKRIFAAPATLATLSPDGRTVATVMKNAIGLIQTDGKRAVYFEPQQDLSISGIVWADGKTLALLGHKDSQHHIDLYSLDGTVTRSVRLPAPRAPGKEETGELAFAPDGRHIVISYGKEVQFLSGSGKLISTWAHEHNGLVQPTFTPDGRLVAFKHMVEAGTGPSYVAAIAFFSPEGKEMATVALPRPDMAVTRPATAPAGGD